MKLGKFCKSQRKHIPLALLFVLIWVSGGWCKGLSQIAFEKKCKTCHSLQRIKRARKTKGKWKKRVAKCAKKTLEWENYAEWINEKDTEIIFKYLVSTQLIEKKKKLRSRGGSRVKFKPQNNIKTAKNPKKLSSIEKIHVPVFILPKVIFSREKFKVTVKVSERTHPMVEEHYISWIELYQDGTLLNKFELSPANREAKVTALLPIENVTALRAVVKCTKHGRWESRKQVRTR